MMHRHLIGILGLVLLLGVLTTWNWEPEGAWAASVKSACWRLGPLLVMLWFALPELERMPRWLWMPVGAAFVLVALRPRLALVLIPLIALLAVLRPRFGRRR
jgi:hypothetical protein